MALTKLTKVRDSVANLSRMASLLLGFGAQIFKGKSGRTVSVGDTIPEGTTHMSVKVNGKEYYLKAWSDLTLPAVIISLPTTDNGFSGYEVETDQGTFEFVSNEVSEMRLSGKLQGWGVVGGGILDETAGIQKAVDYCFATGTNLDLGIPLVGYRFSGTIDFFSGESSGNFSMPYKIIGHAARTKFLYYGSGTAFSFINATSKKSCTNGVIEGGFTVVNAGGTGQIGVHFKGCSYWNTASATIRTELFLDKGIVSADNDGKGGLWNLFGYFICQTDANCAWGFYSTPVANANHYLKILGLGDCTQSNVYLQGDRNIVGQIGVDTGAQASKSCVRVSGKYVITLVELEGSSAGNTRFIAAMQLDSGAHCTILGASFTGVSPRYYAPSDSYLLVLPQEDDDDSALSNGYVTLYNNNGLVIENPLILAKPTITDTSMSTIGVNDSYSSYQNVCSLRNENLRGINMPKRISITNNTDVSVDVQVRNADVYNSYGAYFKIYTIAAGATYELPDSELYDIVGDYDTDAASKIVARLRTSSATYSGTVNFHINSLRF